ncbi:phage terminase small subunit P27 family [Bifidobacterium sp. ESL0728]|uniref:phage terminase small subunit P27 family n=1 Tax=Bifidobacterium sp. ESL0728 TaxID=2983220 RepID=UPI0023F74C46|nr:phage terminase small subunit P27 family [Bifidobacterium sp. ESL0728]WEV59684.1 phage terminase small subunit P27 family [Bifidobacterium sp. ESL0728]
MGARGPLKLAPVGEKPETDATAQSMVDVKEPEKPMGLPDEVSALWDEIVPVLSEAGLLSEADGMTLEMALRHFSTARKASNELLEQGIVVEDKRHAKQKIKSPNAQVFKDNSAAFLEYAKQLGLSFAARSRISVEGSDHGGKEGNPYAID